MVGLAPQSMAVDVIAAKINQLISISRKRFCKRSIDATTGKQIIQSPTTRPKKGIGWEVTTTSGTSEIALAKHLKQTGAKIYIMYTCPHCYKQKQLFGNEAIQHLNVIECLPDGKNSQTKLCTEAKIDSVPAWNINGKFYAGEQSLQKLADLSGYQGDRNFLYMLLDD